MYVLLPDSGVPLDRLIAALEPVRSSQWIESLRAADVVLQLPKFRMEYGVDLVAPLTSLGMGIAFDPGRADFGRMLPRNYLARRNAFIGRVWQKTFVEVDEKGTEAAAATGLEMLTVTSVMERRPPIPFIVDHPFLFLLREEKTGTVLFIGRILDPR
jgi:serpin B